MTKKKKEYNIKVKKLKTHYFYGCSNPQVRLGFLKCDGDCNSCKYQTIEETTNKE